MKTEEEQLAFANENQRLIDEMGDIIKSGFKTAEDIIRLRENADAQAKLWKEYNGSAYDQIGGTK